MGKKDGFYILKLTRTNMNVDQRIGNIEDKPYDYLAMEDAPCMVYLKKNGWPDHVKPLNSKDDFLQEVFESAYLDNTNFRNMYEPYGINSYNLSIGDVWVSRVDSVRRFLNSDSPESITWAYSQHKLKR